MLARVPNNQKQSLLRSKWENELNKEINDTDWNKIVTEVNKITNCTKLRAFHYRLTQRILTTNIHRNKWDPSVPSSCYFCKVNEETYSHLFVECTTVQTIWRALKKWLYHFCYVEFDVDVYTILMNRYKDSFPKMVNTIILIVKQYIYASKCLENQLNFTEVVKRIQKYKTLEHIVAIRHKKTICSWTKMVNVWQNLI